MSLNRTSCTPAPGPPSRWPRCWLASCWPLSLPLPALAQAASEPARRAAPRAGAGRRQPRRRPSAEEAVENPYGLKALWGQGDFVAKGTLIIMVIMSMGSWYIIFTKLFEQRAMMQERAKARPIPSGRPAR